MISVAFRSVSKDYPIYEKPVDRLVELATFGHAQRHTNFPALHDVSFEIEKGETFCLIGENGSGKSTTLQLAAQIFEPSKGEVEIKGRVSALLELGAGFNPEFSGRDNVFLSGAILGLSTKEVEKRYDAITRFAEIGSFVDQPVKTYSSGMLVRLAFATAINVDPEVLLVDEALAVGDYYFRQRCLRKVHELRKAGVTILFVSHAMGDVKAIGSRVLWLEGGRVVELGKPDAVVRKYLGRMAQKDADYLARRVTSEVRRESFVAPEVIETIPNVDHRHGNGAAEIVGVATLDEQGRQADLIEPHSRLILRVSVRANRVLASPNIGFMMRNHLGLDFAGTNTLREGVELPTMAPGDVHTVDFVLDVPELYPGDFSFSPAIADGDIHSYEMCDWIDNATAVQMIHRGAPVYGYLHLPCAVRVNSRLAPAPVEK